MQNSDNIQPPENMNSQESNFAQNSEIMNSDFPKESIGLSNVLDNIKEVGETKILLQNSEINPPINEPVYNSTENFLNNQEISNQNINNESSSLQNTNLDDFIKKSTENETIVNEQNKEELQTNTELYSFNNNNENYNLESGTNYGFSADVFNTDHTNNYDINNLPQETNYDFSNNTLNNNDINNYNFSTTDYNINIGENTDNNNYIINENTENFVESNDYNNLTSENYENYVPTSGYESVHYAETYPVKYLPTKFEDNITSTTPDYNIDINTYTNTDITNINFEANETNYNISSEFTGDIITQGETVDQNAFTTQEPEIQAQIETQNIVDNPITTTEPEENNKNEENKPAQEENPPINLNNIKESETLLLNDEEKKEENIANEDKKEENAPNEEKKEENAPNEEKKRRKYCK
jgi:hypothetical protein